MKKLKFFFGIFILILFGLTACGTQDSASIQTEENAAITESSESSSEEDIPLSKEEKYDKVFSFFTEGENAGKGRHSLTMEAVYYVGADKDDNLIQLMYISDDTTQGVLLSLDREGNLEITVNIKSENESVIGNVSMNAEDYYYGYEFTDFTYDSNETNWDYDNFKIRANAYVRDTMLYGDSILQDYLEIGLQEIGFSKWENPGLFTEEMISADDVAGMWDYKNTNNKEYSSRIYLIDDKIYWRGYEESYADAITAQVVTESDDFILSQGLTMSVFDPWTGEIVVSDNYIGNDDTHEEFRRYIYRNDEGQLCMRVESVYLGMSNSEDGKVYIKLDDESKVSITPSIYDPTSETGTETDDDQDLSENGIENHDSDNVSGNNSYQAILDEYTRKMENAVDGLVSEYRSEAAEVSSIDRLAEICNDKVGDLAEICNEGIGEMADLMYSKGDSYDTYESWAGKLQDSYTEITQKIQDAYLDSAMN